ncbi:DUF4167 domain-containing protein [Devosia epidermidihirudinis]|uniref:DUF4167 domain-containing protein n=1 Tax=Devosia epidermidihirudinis TaxID=1293439 RepID=UPI00069699CE|nr:DUF4167 domain-containing protein [Devosia epidermidihirudinis]
MRPNNQNNKNRQRSRNGGRKHVNPLSRNFESNGPDVKVRGNAAHIAEKYMQLARDAQSSGDSVMAENYLQHAEHYFRIVSSAQQAQSGQRPEGSDDDYDDDMPDMNSRFASPQPQAQQQFVQGEGEDQQGGQPQQNGQQQDGEQPQQDRAQRPDRGERRERQQRSRFRPEGEVQQSTPIEPNPQPQAQPDVVEAVAETATAEPAAVDADGEARKPRERRPRRRRPVAGEGADPATAEQPDVGELPAFLTGGKAATAAE